MEQERKWENLPSDCLVSIFCYLGLVELTVTLPFVCKSWYEASLDPRCWKKLDFQALDFCSESNLERRFKQEYGVRSSFSFSAFMKLCVSRSRGSAVELATPYIEGASILQDLIFASIECPRLKVLAITGIYHQDDNQLHDLISKWKELEILKITWKPISIVEILEQISINCPNFIGLHLYGLFHVVETRAIARCIPRLKILMISGSTICKEDLMVILDGCKELEVLDVSNCAGFDVDNDIIMKASKIKKFECEGTTKEGGLIHYLLVERLKVAAKYYHRKLLM